MTSATTGTRCGRIDAEGRRIGAPTGPRRRLLDARRRPHRRAEFEPGGPLSSRRRSVDVTVVHRVQSTAPGASDRPHHAVLPRSPRRPRASRRRLRARCRSRSSSALRHPMGKPPGARLPEEEVPHDHVGRPRSGPIQVEDLVRVDPRPLGLDVLDEPGAERGAVHGRQASGAPSGTPGRHPRRPAVAPRKSTAETMIQKEPHFVLLRSP